MGRHGVGPVHVGAVHFPYMRGVLNLNKVWMGSDQFEFERCSNLEISTEK